MIGMTYQETMVRSYLESALWTGTDNMGALLDRRFSLCDFSPRAVLQASADCEAFAANCASAGDLLAGMDPEEAGYDFWLTRNGHGAGFWDRGLGERGDRLSDVCRAMGESDLYVGDDRLLYLFPERAT